MTKKITHSLLFLVFVFNYQSAFAADINAFCDGSQVECETKFKASLSNHCDLKTALVRCDGSSVQDGHELKICSAMFVENCHSSYANMNSDEVVCETGSKPIYLSDQYETLFALWNSGLPVSLCKK